MVGSSDSGGGVAGGGRSRTMNELVPQYVHVTCSWDASSLTPAPHFGHRAGTNLATDECQRGTPEAQGSLVRRYAGRCLRFSFEVSGSAPAHFLVERFLGDLHGVG